MVYVEFTPIYTLIKETLLPIFDIIRLMTVLCYYESSSEHHEISIQRSLTKQVNMAPQKMFVTKWRVWSFNDANSAWLASLMAILHW